MSYSAWSKVISEYENVVRLDSNYVFRAYFPVAENGVIDMYLAGDVGKRYKLTLLSRRLDTLSKIDFTPEIDVSGKLSDIRRISEVKFEKTESYYSYSFYYKREEDTRPVHIEFDGISYPGAQPKDFVIFVSKDN